MTADPMNRMMEERLAAEESISGVIWRHPFGDISKENAKHRPDLVPKTCVPECVPEPLRPL